jgi:hypothetical protein
LEGASLPSSLFSGAAGGGAVLPLAGGPVRLAPAPGVGAGMLLATVARGGAEEEEEEEGGGGGRAAGGASRVSFVAERVSGALSLSLAPAALAALAALPSLRSVALRPRNSVPRRPASRLKRVGF